MSTGCHKNTATVYLEGTATTTSPNPPEWEEVDPSITPGTQSGYNDHC